MLQCGSRPPGAPPSAALDPNERGTPVRARHRPPRRATPARTTDGEAMARRLGQPDAPRDDRFVDGVAQVPPRLGGDVGGQVRSGVVHRQHDAIEREVRVQVITDEIDGGKQLGQALECVVLTLERDQDRVGGGQGVDGQEPERRRAIDEDDVVSCAEGLHEAPQPALRAPARRRVPVRHRRARWWTGRGRPPRRLPGPRAVRVRTSSTMAS